MTYLFNLYFCVNKLENQKCGQLLTFPRMLMLLPRWNAVSNLATSDTSYHVYE
jgi:hypothetical protein